MQPDVLPPRVPRPTHSVTLLNSMGGSVRERFHNLTSTLKDEGATETSEAAQESSTRSPSEDGGIEENEVDYGSRIRFRRAACPTTDMLLS